MAVKIDLPDAGSLEIELLQPLELAEVSGLSRQTANALLSERGLVDSLLEDNGDRLAQLNAEIDRLTNHADAFDYALSVTAGLMGGLADIFFVGELDFSNAKRWSYRLVNEFIGRKARAEGCSSSRLRGQVAFLERKYKSPTDNVWKGRDMGISASNHHLSDWTHHPTLTGWICSIIVQFGGKGCFTDSSGELHCLGGVDETLIGDSLCEKLWLGTVDWFGHLVSDVGGSCSTAGHGMGIPGPILATAREFAQLPFLKNGVMPGRIYNAMAKRYGWRVLAEESVPLAKALNVAFVSGKFDFRKEIAVSYELSRQMVPVAIYETLTRLLYFLRRLLIQWRSNGPEDVDWNDVIPVGNRTVVRMLTVASGTFVAFDAADAAMRSRCVDLGMLAVRINYIGVVRFVVACATDLTMGIRRCALRKERMRVVNERIELLGAKMYCEQAGAWVLVGRLAEEVCGASESVGEVESATAETEKLMRGLRISHLAQASEMSADIRSACEDIKALMEEM